MGAMALQIISLTIVYSNNNNNSLFSQELHMIFSLQTQQIWNIHHMYK